MLLDSFERSVSNPNVVYQIRGNELQKLTPIVWKVSSVFLSSFAAPDFFSGADMSIHQRNNCLLLKLCQNDHQ
jgi:hypothetical protein